MMDCLRGEPLSCGLISEETEVINLVARTAYQVPAIINDHGNPQYVGIRKRYIDGWFEGFYVGLSDAPIVFDETAKAFKVLD